MSGHYPGRSISRRYRCLKQKTSYSKYPYSGIHHCHDRDSPASDDGNAARFLSFDVLTFDYRKISANPPIICIHFALYDECGASILEDGKVVNSVNLCQLSFCGYCRWGRAMCSTGNGDDAVRSWRMPNSMVWRRGAPASGGENTKLLKKKQVCTKLFFQLSPVY